MGSLPRGPEKTGITPLIAEVILIGISFAVSIALLAVLMGAASIPSPSKPPALGIEGFEKGSKVLVLMYIEGDTLLDSLSINDGIIEWKNLKVGLSGEVISTDPSEKCTYNGEKNVERVDLGAGDVLKVYLMKPLTQADTLMVHYKGQLLLIRQFL